MTCVLNHGSAIHSIKTTQQSFTTTQTVGVINYPYEANTDGGETIITTAGFEQEGTETLRPKFNGTSENLTMIYGYGMISVTLGQKFGGAGIKLKYQEP